MFSRITHCNAELIGGCICSIQAVRSRAKIHWGLSVEPKLSHCCQRVRTSSALLSFSHCNQKAACQDSIPFAMRPYEEDKPGPAMELSVYRSPCQLTAAESGSNAQVHCDCLGRRCFTCYSRTKPGSGTVWWEHGIKNTSDTCKGMQQWPTCRVTLGLSMERSARCLGSVLGLKARRRKMYKKCTEWKSFWGSEGNNESAGRPLKT